MISNKIIILFVNVFFYKTEVYGLLQFCCDNAQSILTIGPVVVPQNRLYVYVLGYIV